MLGDFCPCGKPHGNFVHYFDEALGCRVWFCCMGHRVAYIRRGGYEAFQPKEDGHATNGDAIARSDNECTRTIEGGTSS